MIVDTGGYSVVKDVHVRVCIENDVESRGKTGLETIGLEGGMPDFAFSDMDPSCSFLRKTLSLPLLIGPITGGGERSTRINRTLAQAAEACGIAMALGSERSMLEKSARSESFMVREFAPTIPLLGNLGLAHVKKGKDYLLEAVESVGADGITIYINPLHEILQKDGEHDFAGCLDALGSIASEFPYPILLKEVGFGISGTVMEWASRHNISGVDVAGSGGTNWAKVEGLVQGKDYSVFESLGTPTRDAIVTGRRNLKEHQCLIASGGIRTGVDMAKCFALGADLASMALPFLRWANTSAEEVIRSVERLRDELMVSLWYCGSRNIVGLKGRYGHLKG